MDGMQNKKQHIVRISQTSPSVDYTTQTSPLLEIFLIVELLIVAYFFGLKNKLFSFFLTMHARSAMSL